MTNDSALAMIKIAFLVLSVGVSAPTREAKWFHPLQMSVSRSLQSAPQPITVHSISHACTECKRRPVTWRVFCVKFGGSSYDNK